MAAHLSRRDARARFVLRSQHYCQRGGGSAHPGAERAGVRNQYRLRQTGERQDQRRRPANAPAQHRAEPCGGGRRGDAGQHRAADDGAETGEPGAGRVGGADGDGRTDRGDACQAVDPGHPGPGIGRRVGRPCPAGAYGGGDDRRGRDLGRGGCSASRAGAGRCRARTARAWPQGGAGAAQRNSIFMRLCAGRPVRGRAAVRLRPADRRLVDRGRQGLRRAVRSADPCAARSCRAGRDGRCLARADGGIDHPRLAPSRRQPGAGPLLPALPAASDGRHPRPVAPGGDDPADRGQRRVGQSADLRRHRRGAFWGQFPCRAGCLCRRHDRHCLVRNRIDRGAAGGDAGRSRSVGAAGVPDPAAGAQFGLYDPPGDGGGAGVREQAARLSRQCRFDPDLGQPGGSCVDGGARGAAIDGDGRQCRGGAGDRISGGGAGH